MAQQGIEFDIACEAFTVACQRAANWKHSYPGAVYRTRITQAIIDLELVIASVKCQPEIAESVRQAYGTITLEGEP